MRHVLKLRVACTALHLLSVAMPIGATVEERLSLFSLNRTRLMSSYHVKPFIPPIRKRSRRAASMRPTQNVEPHQACTYKLLHNKEAQPRRGHVTRTTTDTSTARATRCARPMRAPSDRHRPRGSMRSYTCVYHRPDPEVPSPRYTS